jgi:hypothetical protein
MHVAARAHSSVVVSVGNDGKTNFHTKGDVPKNGSFDVKFNVVQFDVQVRYIEVWYPAGGQLNAKVIAPGNTVLVPIGGTHPDGVLPPNEGQIVLRAQDEGALITVDSETAVQDNGDNRIFITFNAGARPKDQWALQLINPTNEAISFHAWIDPDEAPPAERAPRFSNPTTDVTINIPATAHRAIAVAAFQNRKDCCDCFPSGDIADFSSRGPVRKDANNNEKPNITAPGKQITSPDASAANLRGDPCDCCPDWCCGLYKSEDGTSVAAPHVAGAIALMLEVNPNLTRDDIAKILHDTALHAPAPADKDTWGAGKLNADAAVQKAAQMPGGGGGGPPTPALRRRRSTAVTSPPRDAQPPRPAGESAMRLIAARMRAVPNGEAYAALISRHFSEVRRLINGNPRIATMWHRGEGPKMLRRLVQGAVDETAEAPVRTATQRQYLSRFLDQLARFGSAKLAANVHAHAGAMVRVLERPLAAQVVAREGARGMTRRL